jgi:hypothetical protein
MEQGQKEVGFGTKENCFWSSWARQGAAQGEQDCRSQ